MEHVLPNSVTGEAAVAGLGADWVLGEPCSLTKDMEHVTLDFRSLFLSFSSYSQQTSCSHFSPIYHDCLPSCWISLPPWRHFIKPHVFCFSREFIMSCFSILIIPLNMQSDSHLCQPACQIFIQPLSQSISQCCHG